MQSSLPGCVYLRERKNLPLHGKFFFSLCSLEPLALLTADAGLEIMEIAELIVITGAIITGLVSVVVVTRVVTLLVLTGVSVEVLVTVTSIGVGTAEEETLAGDVRDTAVLRDPFIRVEIFEESMPPITLPVFSPDSSSFGSVF